MHYNCLIIDDETDLSKMTQEYFEMFDVSCQVVSTSDECLAFLKENTVDVFLLDINLGDESGFTLCKKLREDYDSPILFISARQSDDDVLVALNIGGDDYLKKPYPLSILLAKVKVLLKRIEAVRGMKSGTTPVSAYGAVPGTALGTADTRVTEKQETGIIIDEPTMSVRVRGSMIALKAKEFALLKCLYDHKNTIVTKEKLFDEVWGDSFYSDGTLNVHIRRLREKIEDDPNAPCLIKTVWGTGYMLEIPE